ncbi:hypothetical protein [Actinokineospora sp. HUAS TT18]|uniref:hypothetical protein n=1 Tax=Actinokineospora sp. HUAS TT18 TaxID=3447451 RepID=UPI003F51F605
MTTTLNTTTPDGATVGSAAVLAAVAEHLDVFAELPAPVVTTVCATVDGGKAVSFQLDSEYTLRGLAGALLAWVDTLDRVACEAWRHGGDDSHTMHVSVSGQLTDGTPVRVFAPVDYPHGLGLAPSARRPLGLGLLRAWTAGEEACA